MRFAAKAKQHFPMLSNPPAPAHHIRLTSHPGQQGVGGAPILRWGAVEPLERGPVVGTTANRSQRTVIGTHSGSYGVYRALAVGDVSVRSARWPRVRLPAATARAR